MTYFKNITSHSTDVNLHWILSLSLRFACRKSSPKEQPNLGREPVQKVRNYEQSVRRTRLFCTKFDELISLLHPPVSICSHILPIIPTLYSRELFQFASRIHCRTSHRSSSKRSPMQHSARPTFMREIHYVASKFPLFRSAVFSPCFHVTCINHFSRARCFQICQISCHGSPQQIPPGVPTIYLYIYFIFFERSCLDDWNWLFEIPCR